MVNTWNTTHAQYHIGSHAVIYGTLDTFTHTSQQPDGETSTTSWAASTSSLCTSFLAVCYSFSETAAQCVQYPVILLLWTASSVVLCAWFQVAYVQPSPGSVVTGVAPFSLHRESNIHARLYRQMSCVSRFSVIRHDTLLTQVHRGQMPAQNTFIFVLFRVMKHVGNINVQT